MDPSLHCPTCGYNLTGLPENRCPECGSPFSPQELRWLARAGFDYVSTRAMMYYLLSAPVGFWFLNAVCVRWELPGIVGLAGTALSGAWAIVNSIHWALRATEPQRLQQGKRPLAACLSYFLTAMFFQLLIGAGPCMILV